MFGNRIRLFSLFGFEVRMDPSWLVIAVLVVWSLAKGYFPYMQPGIPPRIYWFMGVAGAAGLFISIVFHEFWHSLVARQFGLPMKGITLFIFGGVAEMGEEPTNPKTEFLMAAAGPLSSLVLAALFYAGSTMGKGMQWSRPIIGVMDYMTYMNIILAVFNLVPAFPLDGGRILRSILWAWKGDFRWATKIASTVGSGFGIFLIVMGVLNVLRGNFIGGMWWFLIGMFLRSVAGSTNRRLQTRKALEGEPLSRFINRNPVTAPPDISIETFVEDYIYRHHYKFFPVVDNGHLVGCVSTKEIKEIPREEWPRRSIGELARNCSAENTIAPDADAVEALSAMNRTGASRLMVTQGDRLIGVVALKDMLDLLALKMELEG
jgi:Zn-dependent protease